MPKQAPVMKKRSVRGSRTGRPIMALLDLLGRRWSLRIIWELREASLTSIIRISSESSTTWSREASGQAATT